MRTYSRSILAAALWAAFSALPMSASAGIFDDTEARKAILDIRARIDEANARVDTKADKGTALELANQNEQLRQEVARLRGQIEVLTNELANAERRQKDFYVDLDNRMRKLEPQKVTVDGRETSVEASEQKAYDSAMALFKAGDYRNAAASLNDFLRRYPQSGYAPGAQYVLGTSYYALRDYKNAISAQQVVMKSFADSPRAPDALLNIASSYTELKDKASAKKTLESLVAQYPDSAAAQTARERLASLR